jgi:hypothetical protein
MVCLIQMKKLITLEVVIRIYHQKLQQQLEQDKAQQNIMSFRCRCDHQMKYNS